MRLEDLNEALRRSNPERARLTAELRDLRGKFDLLTARQEALLAKARPEDRAEYLANAAARYDVQASLTTALETSAASISDLEHALRNLPRDWHAAMPGRGLFSAVFFVRSFRIEDGKPAAYDPFWIETCIKREGAEDEKLLALHAAWASGGALRPNGSDPSDPVFAVRRPFGPERDAARAPCGGCGGMRCVIGYKELAHWTEDDDWPYLQSLSVLCHVCPRLTPLAARRDLPPPRLHP